MKEQAIQKINKAGKISSVVATICKIVVILGLVLDLVVAIRWFVIPESAMKITKNGTMTVEMDFADAGIPFSEDDLKNMQMDKSEGEWQIETDRNGMVNGQLELVAEGHAYTPTDVAVTENGAKIEMTSTDITYTMRDVAGWMMAAAVVLIMTIILLTFVESLCKAFRDCTSPFEENVIKKMERFGISLIPWTIISTLTESIQTSVMSGAMEWSLGIDLGVVLMVLIVLILVYIFKYGAVLQQESDETL